MGKVLQIRVMARTFDPRDVERRWPRLHVLAWPEAEMPRGDMRHDAAVGVLELVELLGNVLRFGPLDKAVREALSPGLAVAEGLKERLESALADWKPSAANALSDDLEEALDRLESAAPKPED